MKNIIALCLVLVSCSSSNLTEKDPETSNSVKTNDVYECVDENNEILKCGSNEDCCPHFTCNFNPEVSRVQRYCVYNAE